MEDVRGQSRGCCGEGYQEKGEDDPGVAEVGALFEVACFLVDCGCVSVEGRVPGGNRGGEVGGCG